MKSFIRGIQSERNGLKAARKDSLGGWGLAGLITGISAGGLLIGTVAGRYVLPKQYGRAPAPAAAAQ